MSRWRGELKRIARRTFTLRCPTGKRRYPSRAAAFEAYRRIRSAPKGKPPTDFYPCGRCGGFHLTTKTNDGREER